MSGTGQSKSERGRTILAEAEIGEETRAKILHRNAAAMMSRLAKVAQRETVAA